MKNFLSLSGVLVCVALLLACTIPVQPEPAVVPVYNWVALANTGLQSCSTVSTSDDGRTVVASDGIAVSLSHDAGVTWVSNSLPGVPTATTSNQTTDGNGYIRTTTTTIAGGVKKVVVSGDGRIVLAISSGQTDVLTEDLLPYGKDYLNTTYTGKVFLLKDGAASWVELPVLAGGANWTDVWISSDGQQILVTSNHNTWSLNSDFVWGASYGNPHWTVNNLGGGLYQSKDGGQNWAKVGGDHFSAVSADSSGTRIVALMPNGKVGNGNYMWYYYSTDAYRSLDSGMTWQITSLPVPSNTSGYYVDLLSSRSGNYRYVYGGSPTLQSLDQGASWTANNHFAFAGDRDFDAVVSVSAQSGENDLLLSFDRFATSPISQAAAGKSNWDCAAVAGDGSVIFAGSIGTSGQIVRGIKQQ